MRSRITSSPTTESLKYDIWRNPQDNILYGTFGDPKYGFKEVDAFPIYDLNAHLNSVKIAKEHPETNQDSLPGAVLDPEFGNLVDEYQANIILGGRQKQAALRSQKNSAVNIVNVWTEILGRYDRPYAGKFLAKEIPTNNLVISIDKITKFTGMTQIDEGQLTQTKELTYSRANFRAVKYGLKFIISEESRLVNVHNVLQDSVMVASNKIEQKASFDVINAAAGLTAQSALGVWDSFVASTSRSTTSALQDIGIAQLNIEGSGVGGSLDVVGMHQITYNQWLGNSFVRGVAPASPVAPFSFQPGTQPLVGVPKVTLVLDNGITQGITYAVSTTRDPTIAYFQGPQRIGSAHDEETGDDKYFIIDYHFAGVIQPETGRQITGCGTPIAW
jgi:hypothetical protein